MPSTRRRRIVRRAVMVLAVVVLLVVLYVGSAISASFAWGAGWIPSGMAPVIETVYAPLTWYVDTAYPGSDSLNWAAMKARRLGDRLAN